MIGSPRRLLWSNARFVGCRRPIEGSIVSRERSRRRGREERGKDVLDVLERVEDAVSEREYEQRADQVEDDVEGGVLRAVRDEYRLEPETVRRGVNGVLDELPDEAKTDDGGDDLRAWIASPPTAGGANHPAQNRRGVGVREVVPPPDVVVRTEHPDGVVEQRGVHVRPLPRLELDIVRAFDEIGKVPDRGRRSTARSPRPCRLVRTPQVSAPVSPSSDTSTTGTDRSRTSASLVLPSRIVLNADFPRVPTTTISIPSLST